MVRGERGHHLVRPAQNDLERRIGFKRCCDTFEHDGGRVVAAHSVNCKNGSGKRLGRSARSGQLARFPSQGELLSGRRDCTHLVKKPPVRAQGRTEMGGSRLAYVKKLGRTRRARKPLFGLDNFAVLVEAAVRAHAMRKLHFAALRAHGTRRCVDAVVSAATVWGACTTRFCLGTAQSLFVKHRRISEPPAYHWVNTRRDMIAKRKRTAQGLCARFHLGLPHIMRRKIADTATKQGRAPFAQRAPSPIRSRREPRPHHIEALPQARRLAGRATPRTFLQIRRHKLDFGKRRAG